MPATPLGVMELLKRYEITTEGKNCVVVGASRLVGAALLDNYGPSSCAAHLNVKATACSCARIGYNELHFIC